MIKELDLIQVNQGSKSMMVQFDTINKYYIAHLFDSKEPTKYQAPIILKSAEHPFWQRNGFSPLEKVNASKQMTNSADIFQRLRELR
jgi:hypothetical protein